MGTTAVVNGDPTLLVGIRCAMKTEMASLTLCVAIVLLMEALLKQCELMSVEVDK